MSRCSLYGDSPNIRLAATSRNSIVPLIPSEEVRYGREKKVRKSRRFILPVTNILFGQYIWSENAPGASLACLKRRRLSYLDT